MTFSSLFYVSHESGTKNKWMVKIVKEFLCHESVNKFNLKESGECVDNHVNKQDNQYVIIYRLAGTQEEDTSIHSDVSITMNDDLSDNSF